MAHSNNQDEKVLILDLVEDAVIPGPDAIEIGDAFQLLTPGRARVPHQGVDLPANLASYFLRKGGQLFAGLIGQLDPVG
jgi:hypothetical protein